MITIKAGKLFCEKYNEVNNTNHTPKEIFCNVIAKIAWDGNNLIQFDKNDAFHQNSYSKLSFDEKLENFCKEIENDTDNFGLMTSKRVFGGCACQNLTEMQTTYAMIGDDMYFDINERYCSFIGAMFCIKIGRYLASVSNKNFIWDTFESIKAYRDTLDSNELITNKIRLTNWNGCYMFRKYVLNETKINPLDIFDNIKGEITSIGFIEFMLILSKLDEIPQYIELESYGETNCTCGQILLSNKPIKTLKEFYTNCFDANTQFDWKKFNKSEDKDKKKISTHILNEIIKNGSVNCKIEKYVIRNLALAIKPFNYKNLDCIMKKEDIEKAKELCSLLKECSDSTKNSLNTQTQKLLESKSSKQFFENLIELSDYANYDHHKFINIVDYVMQRNEEDRNAIFDILLYARFLV